jgi:ABC-type branched-subunit amino acid transport system substrate-binding protein
MPRYQIEDRDVEVLVHYLKNLSAEWSPGIADGTLRLATVVAGEVNPAERDAMLAALGAHVRDHNTQSRNNAARGRKASFFTDYAYATYRSIELRTWEVKGPPGTWRDQLHRLHQGEPPFALVGGLAAGPWQPIHDFCEETGLPCLFPATDRPVTDGANAYTLYFSRGLRQEGETAARFLVRAPAFGPATKVVQVMRSEPGGEDLAAGFKEAWTKAGGAVPPMELVSPGTVLATSFWRGLFESHPGAVFALWLEAPDLTALSAIGASQLPPAIVVSGGLMGERLVELPAEIRSFVYATYPYSLPEEESRRVAFVERWLRTRGLAMTHQRLQARMYFVGWMLSAALSRMRGELYRDYLLDVLDMMADETFAVALYPRLSFGPGQRYASKGCYVVQLGPGAAPRLEPRSDWVIH